MAGDLIPPPSPAGRPSGDAEAERERAREREEARRRQGGLWSRSSESEQTGAGAVVEDLEADGAPAPPAAPAVESPYRSRFGLVLGALLGIAIATLAIGAAVYVSTGGDDVPANWSSWRPGSEDGLTAAQEIADHVAPKYRTGKDDNQLVGIRGGPLEFKVESLGLTLPLDIMMKTAPHGGAIEYIEGNGLMYTLSGTEPDGAISGKPTEERAILLRREALEIALYTFRYIEDVDLVVTILPPATVPKKPAAATATPAAPGAPAATATPTPSAKADDAVTETVKQPQALFFRPGDLQQQLEIPLASTIPQQRTDPDSLKLDEAVRIADLTEANVFGFSYQYSQDRQSYLVLERLPK